MICSLTGGRAGNKTWTFQVKNIVAFTTTKDIYIYLFYFNASNVFHSIIHINRLFWWKFCGPEVLWWLLRRKMKESPIYFHCIDVHRLWDTAVWMPELHNVNQGQNLVCLTRYVCNLSTKSLFLFLSMEIFKIYQMKGKRKHGFDIPKVFSMVVYDIQKAPIPSKSSIN